MEQRLGVEGAVFSPLKSPPPSRTPTHAARSWSTASLGRWASAIVLCGLLAACSSQTAPVAQVARQCVHVGGKGETALPLISPQAGMLLVTVAERGLSVSADLDSSGEASSPVARLGTIVLLTATTASQPHTLHLRTEDDPDLAGEACVMTEVIPSSQGTRSRAARSAANAARSVHLGDWANGFAQYLSAARAYDDLGLRRQAAEARYAMAELAYRRFDRKRDSLALASIAISDYGAGADPVYRGALVALQAKALIDMPGADAKRIAPDILERLAAARRYESGSSLGARELVRLDTTTGQLEYILDAPERAREVFIAVALRCREMHDWDCYGVASQNLAVIAEESNNYSAALAAYDDALHYLSPQLEPKLVAAISNNMGRIQGAVGFLSSSERSYATALRMFAKLGDCHGARRTLALEGGLLVQIGTLGDAESDLDRAATLSCQALLAAVQPALPTGSPEQLPTRGYTEERAARLNLCLHPLDPTPLASDNLVTIFDSLLALSDALMLEGEPEHARRCLEAAQPYASTARAQMRWANARGELLLARNEADAAHAAFERSLSIADAAKIPSAQEHRAYAQLGVVKSELLTGESPDLLPNALTVLKSSVARGNIDQTVMSLRLVAAGYRKANRNADAAHTLRAAVDLIEAVPIDELDGERRATYLATQHTVFAELTDLLASQVSADETAAWQAFSVSERGRARSLRYAVSQTTQGAADSLAAPRGNRYGQMLRKLVLTGSDSAGGSAHLIDAIENASLEQAGDPEPLDRERLSQTLGKLNATLVEYAAGSQDMFAFVLGEHGLRVVRLGKRAEIASAAAELRDLLRDGETPAASVRSAAARVARAALWPLRAELTGRRLIFVPDDALHTIPFSVLPWSDDTNSDLVLQHAEATSAPSALFLTNVHLAGPIPDPAPRIALVGDPVFRISDWQRQCVERAAPAQHTARTSDRSAGDWTESLPSLPGTRVEVAMVAKLAQQTRPASRVETLLGCAAVANALRSAANGGADLLHIATHARVDAERPRLSALALTPDSATSPPTSAFGLLDILGLKLKSRLVVLSACDTSRGRLLPGEGVLGPAQAFLQAGSAAVLATYWRIDDAETADFMQKFYTHLFAEHLPAAAALRSAQLEAARTASSHTWAAFALYGWPDSSI
jgi:CHAT domain-containing protein